jgi:CRISPR type I-D-associated protein Csc2
VRRRRSNPRNRRGVDKMSEVTQKIMSVLPKEVPFYRSPVTVQILLLRQTHDYAVFRTEETRELNIAVTPASISDPTQVTRVVFLASKQKAPESREFAATIKYYFNATSGDLSTLNVNWDLINDKKSNGVQPKFFDNLRNSILECELKDRLCRACPRCSLFGAVVTENKGIWKRRWNIKHRIEYSSAFSLEPYEELSENLTFNAVAETTQSTGQALNVTENVVPLANFPSVVTLVSPTWEELVLVIKNLLKCKSYGAESRTKGDTLNYVMGLVIGNEEIISSLEYTLELSDKKRVDLEATQQILEKYSNYAAFPDALHLITGAELEKFMDEVSSYKIDKQFVEKVLTDSLNFAVHAESLGD